jgi:aspartyl-tRNA(Asn)/glutamyl-tRNA(Gln) amidotransferase subunit A
MTDPGELTTRAAAAAIAEGSLSATELVSSLLELAESVQPGYAPFVTIEHETALAAARVADAARARGERRGALHGVPAGVKDLIDVEGVPTLAGSRARAGHVAGADADVVRSMRDHGGIVLGKTVTHEFACGWESPPARCAWDADCVPGGSSGGSAVAVATGAVPFALGTDTGSSIRNPAALNGVVGFKPTYGLISRRGVVPCAWSLDHVGVMARVVDDCALVLGALTDRPLSVERRPVTAMRVGVPENFFFDELTAPIRAAIERAVAELERLGVEVVPVRLPYVEHSLTVAWILCMVEGAALHRGGAFGDRALYGLDVDAQLRAGDQVPGHLYVDAQRVRRLIVSNLRRAFDTARLDAIAVPCTCAGPVPVGVRTLAVDGGPARSLGDHYAALTCPFNLAGMPAISVPCGFDGDGCPIGLQLAGRPFGDATVLQLAAAYEAATEWHRMRPPLASSTVDAA